MTTRTIYTPDDVIASTNPKRSPELKIANGYAITLSHEQLLAASEGGVLRLIVSLYGFLHPAEKSVEAVAAIAQVDPGTIIHAQADQTHLGKLARLRLRAIDFGLFAAWEKVQEGVTR